jgi:hypothetical protein
MITRDEYERAAKRGERMMRDPKGAVWARYDRHRRRIVARLRSKLEISFSPRDVEGLDHATPAELAEVEITPLRLGLHWEKLDADLWIPGLLQGAMGSRKWMAARLGQTGGKATNPAKKAASRANGRLGSRPKKNMKRQPR